MIAKLSHSRASCSHLTCRRSAEYVVKNRFLCRRHASLPIIAETPRCTLAKGDQGCEKCGNRGTYEFKGHRVCQRHAFDLIEAKLPRSDIDQPVTKYIGVKVKKLQKDTFDCEENVGSRMAKWRRRQSNDKMVCRRAAVIEIHGQKFCANHAGQYLIDQISKGYLTLVDPCNDGQD